MRQYSGATSTSARMGGNSFGCVQVLSVLYLSPITLPSFQHAWPSPRATVFSQASIERTLSAREILNSDGDEGRCLEIHPSPLVMLCLLATGQKKRDLPP
jgi:hypothetical protein